jgi:hypothetical protein
MKMKAIERVGSKSGACSKEVVLMVAAFEYLWKDIAPIQENKIARMLFECYKD